MGSIRQPYDYGRGGTKYVDFIRCADSREPQTRKMWCLGSDSVIREIYPVAQVDIASGTVGQFTTNYFSENGCIITIVGQLYIIGSV